jgi:hypothetical protein
MAVPAAPGVVYGSSAPVVQFTARALFHFAPEKPGDLRLTAGDMIQVVRMLDPSWWEGHSAAGYGVFPGTYCEAVVPGRELKPILQPDQLAQPMAAVQLGGGNRPVGPEAPLPPTHYGIFKILLVGDRGVGKSSLIAAITNKADHIDYACPPTMQICVSKSKIPYGGGEVDLELFEAPDTGLFPDPSRQALYKDMDAVMIVFSMLNRASFENARNRWRNEVKFEMARGPAIQTMAVVGTGLPFPSCVRIY